ncbi:MAG: dockerin type I domain-containing protein [Aureliella sp.]
MSAIHRKRLGLEPLEDRRMLATFTVFSTGDSGPGSLREAITQANLTPANDTIEFALPQGKTIAPISELPWITSPLTIDGTSQPGFTGDPIVELTGSNLIGFVDGLTILGGNSQVLGLVINAFGGPGIRLMQGGSNVIANNFIGTDVSGEVAVGNGFTGVLIQNSANNQIGGSYGVNGNLISGNDIEGVRIEGDDATGNHVFGNRIGTNADGTQAIPNTRDGVLIQNGASNNIVGVDGDGNNDEAEKNLLSGNTMSGLRIFGGNSNVVAGNLIGVNEAATAALPNQDNGILVDDFSEQNLIGSNADNTSDELERNLISGNGFQGVRFDTGASQNTVSGNYVGTAPAGSSAIGNGQSGIVVFGGSNRNQIGTADGQYLGNLISGNGDNGVWVFESHENVISGNLIGVDAAGTSALQNLGRGILVNGGSARNLFGTNDNTESDAAERNIVSGNFHQGVAIGGEGTNDNIIAGNYIGTDISGSSAIPNTSTGILISADASRNIVGTSAGSRDDSAAGNLISGNEVFGLRFRNGADFNSAGGNWIGLDATGKNEIPNGASGVGTFQAATNNTIGGSSAKERNIISGNAGSGILIQEDSGDNRIDGNWIGLDKDGGALGNVLGGIRITEAANNAVGGSLPNTIANNGSFGIAVEGEKAVANRISRNSIFGNEGLGIDLGNDGRTADDSMDLDTGPNDLQNAPKIDFVQRAASTFISGTLNSLPDSTFIIEFFASATAGDNAQGNRYLDQIEITTDGMGNSAWSKSLPAILDGESVTATATRIGDATSDRPTSEFAVGVLGLLPIAFRTESSSYSEDVGSFTANVSRDDLDSDLRLVVEFGDYPTDQMTLPETIIIPAGVQSVDFEILVNDDLLVEGDQRIEVIGCVEGVATDKLEFTIVDNDVALWHNSATPNDVNNDGFVTPLDALLVINFLNNNVDSNLTDRPPETPPVFVDVNSDNFATAIDALIVINALNGEGEGEHDFHLPDNALQPEFESIDYFALFEDLRRAKLVRPVAPYSPA